MTIEWISVRDRVPNNRRQILVYGKNLFGNGVVLVDKYNPGGIFDCENSRFTVVKVTHWAELNYPLC